MQDKLEEIFVMQKSLNEYIAEKRSLSFTKEEWLQKRALALIEETMELLNEVNYKWWKNPKQQDQAAINEELVDMLHFFVGMCIDAGLTASEIHEIYIKKNKENYDRQNGLSNKRGYDLTD